MICALYTLMNKYKNKRVYIWNVNRHSMIIFTRAIFRKINVQGFVALQNQYIGELYMNRPVIGVERIQEEDCVVIVADEVPKSVINVLPDSKVVYWSDSLEFNDELRYKRSIIYGIGWGADELHKKGIITELYCVTQKEHASQTYKGKKVIDITELEKYPDYAVIISVTTSKYKWEILETLSDFQGDVYLESLMEEWDIMHVNLIQNLDIAVKNNWEIYLYSKKNLVAQLIEEALNIYSVEISGHVYEIEQKEKSIECIYKL